MSILTLWRNLMNTDKAPMYPDEYLDHHADEFQRKRIFAHGVTLEQYLSDPARYDHLEFEPEPLLQEQVAVALRFEPEVAQAEATLQELTCRNGTLIEPMHHHRHPRSKTCDFRRKTRGGEDSSVKVAEVNSATLRYQLERAYADQVVVDQQALLETGPVIPLLTERVEHSGRDRRANGDLRRLVMIGSLMAEMLRHHAEKAGQAKPDLAEMWERQLLAVRKMETQEG